MANTLILIIISIISFGCLITNSNPTSCIAYIFGLSVSVIIIKIILSIIDHFMRAKEIKEAMDSGLHNHKMFDSVAKALYTKYTAHASVILDMCVKNEDGSLYIPKDKAEIIISVSNSNYDELPLGIKCTLRKNAVKFMKLVKKWDDINS